MYGRGGRISRKIRPLDSVLMCTRFRPTFWRSLWQKGAAYNMCVEIEPELLMTACHLKMFLALFFHSLLLSNQNISLLLKFMGGEEESRERYGRLDSALMCTRFRQTFWRSLLQKGVAYNMCVEIEPELLTSWITLSLGFEISKSQTNMSSIRARILQTNIKLNVNRGMQNKDKYHRPRVFNRGKTCIVGPKNSFICAMPGKYAELHVPHKCANSAPNYS